MTITKIDVWDLRPSFRDGPYAMSHVVSSHADCRILGVQDDEGRVGVGEIVFSPALAPTDRAARIRDEEGYLSPLIGQPFDALLDLAADLRARDKTWRGIAFGLEVAWFDREGRRTGQTAGRLLGGARQTAVADYVSISEASIDAIRARMERVGHAHEVLQLKLGVGALTQDIDQLAALLGMMRGDQVVQADANGGWTVDEACEIVGRFDDPRVIWEEPCATYEDNVRVAERSGGYVMADQSIGDLDAALRAIDERIVQSVCIKPAPLGGLSTARQVRDRAAEAGMRMRIDGPWCGDIATAAILHVAIGAPPDLLLSGCDLREPLSLPVDLQGVRRIAPDRIAPSDGDGLGVRAGGVQLGPPEKTVSAG